MTNVKARKSHSLPSKQIKAGPSIFFLAAIICFQQHLPWVLCGWMMVFWKPSNVSNIKVALICFSEKLLSCVRHTTLSEQVDLVLLQQLPVISFWFPETIMRLLKIISSQKVSAKLSQIFFSHYCHWPSLIRYQSWQEMQFTQNLILNKSVDFQCLSSIS